jgi:hypothetical protein
MSLRGPRESTCSNGVVDDISHMVSQCLFLRSNPAFHDDSGWGHKNPSNPEMACGWTCLKASFYIFSTLSDMTFSQLFALAVPE